MMLRQGSQDEIRNMIIEFRTEIRSLLKDIVSLVYFMRGAIQYSDMLQLTPGERGIIRDFLAERLEDEREKQHPVY